MTAASLALTGGTVVAALGFTRIFADGGDVLPAVVAGVLAHAVAQAALRREWGPALTMAAFFLGLPLLATWVLAPDTTAYGVPTPESLGRLGGWLEEGFGRLRTSKVPVRDADELAFLAMSACWFGGLSAEWVAFRAGAVLTAMVPAATVFTLTASLGTNENEALLGGAFAATALAFVLAHSPHAGGARGSLVRVGAPLVAVVAVAAALVGPNLPEARSAGLVDLKDATDGPRTRFTVSPLIGIRDQLNRQPPVDAFTVRANRPAYWRLTALETFNGDIWSSEGRARGLSDTLPSDSEISSHRRVRQRFRISGLSQFWLPAAYRPVNLELDDAKYIPDSLTLVTDSETAAGLKYRVESLVPEYTADSLQSASFTDPTLMPEALALPGGFPSSISQLARDVTVGRLGGNPTPYALARSLQDFFRSEFEYDETVPPGHSLAGMEDFLFVSRTGYCEQFASAFAAMARSLGLPARVAVGFTPGTPDRGVYRVTSREAHAWPEVWLPPFGWVAFEPTPARHEPSPANHTGTYRPSAAPPPQPQPEPATVTTLAPGSRTTPTTAAANRGGDLDEPASPWPRRLALAAALLVTATAAVAVGAVLVTRHERQRRRRQPDPRLAVLAAWEELVQRLRDDGVGVAPSRTPAEVAEAAAARRPHVAEAVSAVSTLVQEAVWSARAPQPDAVRAAWRAVDSVVGLLDRAERPRARVVRTLRSAAAALTRRLPARS